MAIHAQACWKLATVVKDDLNVQKCQKSKFDIPETASKVLGYYIFPFSFHLLDSPDFLFSSPEVGNFQCCFPLIREPEVT